MSIPLVGGGDAYVGLEIDVKESLAEIPSAHLRVPLVSDNMVQELAQIPESEEISALGAVETLEVGQGVWRGQFRTLIYYNAKWFHWFMCQLMGGVEIYDADELVDGNATSSLQANVHAYVPQNYNAIAAGSAGALTFGMNARIIKFGPVNTAPANMWGERIDHLHIVAATFEFPDQGWPTVTWEVVGQFGVFLDFGTGPATIKAVDLLDYPIKPGDIGIAPGRTPLPSASLGGLVAGTRNISTLRITVRNNINYVPRWANSFDTQGDLGHDGKVSVEVACTSLLEQNEMIAGTAGAVYPTWLSALFEQDFLRIRAVSAPDGASQSNQTPMVDDGAADVPYAFDFYAPRASARSMAAPVESGGNLQLSWGYRCFVAPVPAAGIASSTTWNVPCMFQFQVATVDDTDAKFSAVLEGGNDPYLMT